MADTFIKIARVDVGAGGASSIDFTSISSAYTDLYLVTSTRDTAAGANSGYFKVTFNGSTASNYSTRFVYGSGSGVGSGSTSSAANLSLTGGGSADSAGNTASTFQNSSLYIPNYAGSTAKSVSFDTVGENNATAAYAVLEAGLWSLTSAINQITITPTTLFAQYSSATLYGILKA